MHDDDLDLDPNARRVLDHGFIRVVETWGRGDSGLSEAGIIEAARQSTQGSFRGWERDKRLLRYLYTHKHSTPFEFAGAVIEVRAPIFVFRQWVRHRTQSLNEASARYTQLPDLFYVPSVDRLMMTDEHNKQAGGIKGAEEMTAANADDLRSALSRHYSDYERMRSLMLQLGSPKELARIGGPVAQYSQMRASANLRNWLGFLTLRMDPHAQWETRQYAIALHDLLLVHFPRTMTLFDEVD